MTSSTSESVFMFLQGFLCISSDMLALDFLQYRSVVALLLFVGPVFVLHLTKAR